MTSEGHRRDLNAWDELILCAFVSRPTLEHQQQILQGIPEDIATAWPADAAERGLLRFEGDRWIVMPDGYQAAKRSEGVSEISVGLPPVGPRDRNFWRSLFRRGVDKP